MIGNDIQRVEELRYIISSSTYDILRRKRRGDSVSNAETELASMKEELTRLLSEIQDAGYIYMLMNKKRINELKSNFMALDAKNRVLALDSQQGEGRHMLSEMMSLLLLNKERKASIANLILSLPAANDVVEGIRSVVEGYSDRATIQLESSPAAGRISLALKGVGLSAEDRNQTVHIGAAMPPAPTETLEELQDHDYEEDLFGDVGQASSPPLAKSVRPSIQSQQQSIQAPQPPVAFISFPESNSPVVVIPPAKVSKGTETALAEAEVIVPETPNRRSTDPKSPHQVIEQEGIQDVEHQPAKEQLRSEDLMPNLTYEETCQKIQQIMGNHKMKRWVLGAFKNDEERAQYPKVQDILIKLMRLKSTLESKGQTK